MRDTVDLGASSAWAFSVNAPQLAAKATDIANTENSLLVDLLMVLSY